MRKILIFIFLISIATNYLFAQSGWSLKAGFNYSTFYDEQDNDWLPGYTFGINKYWQVYDDFGISTELLYTIKGGIIKHKPLGPYMSSLPQDVSYIDLHLSMGFLKMPILLEYRRPINENIDFSIFAGVFFAIPTADYSEMEKRDLFINYDPENPEHAKLQYEYYHTDSKGFGFIKDLYKQNKGYELGTRLYYKKYIMEIKYTRDTQVFGFVDHAITRINKKPHSINVLFGRSL